MIMVYISHFHKITEQPRLEGTSKDRQIQPFMVKGSLDEIMEHPVQLHLENVQ